VPSTLLRSLVPEKEEDLFQEMAKIRHLQAARVEGFQAFFDKVDCQKVGLEEMEV
jgi:sulfur transfer protein SufE